MDLITFAHTAAGGWSIDPLPQLDSPRTLVLVFGAPERRAQPEAFAALAAAYPNAHILGCSTAGEILGTTIADESLAVAVARFAHTDVKTAYAAVEGPDDTQAAGQALARQLFAPNLRGVLVLSDGHNVNGSALVRGLNDELPDPVVVTGGLAGDGDRFEQTWVLKEGRPQAGFVSAVGFYGDHVVLGHGSKGGWDFFGIERRVTRSQGNVLYELDGRPALQLYKEYLGDRADGLPATALLFPLALRTDADTDKQVVRTVLSVDEAAQSMTFAGDIPGGAWVQLMRANFDRLVDGASEAALMTQRTLPADTPVLSIAISCVGPPQTQQVGFYSYGEISPYTAGVCDLHNQTMTLTTIAEVC